MFKSLNCGALGHGASFPDACALAERHGFAGVDLDIGYARQHGAAAVRELLDRHGLRPGPFGLSVRWREADDDRSYADSLGRFVEECRVAAELGATRCTTWVLPFSDNLPYHRHFERFVARMRPVAQILAGFGGSLGLEFIGPRTLRAGHRHGFIYTMDGMRAAAAAIGTGNVGFLLDSFHWYTAQATASDIEQLDAAEVVAVHLNDGRVGVPVHEQIDNQRELPGTGVIDLGGFFAALRGIGYDGPVTVEPFNQALRELPIADAVAKTSQAMDAVM